MFTNDDEHHVVPNPDGGWDVVRSGAQRASRHYDTKEEALDSAREISRNQETELVIHRKDGTIQKWHSYGNTRRRTRGVTA